MVIFEIRLIDFDGVGVGDLVEAGFEASSDELDEVGDDGIDFGESC